MSIRIIPHPHDPTRAWWDSWCAMDPSCGVFLFAADLVHVVRSSISTSSDGDALLGSRAHPSKC